MGPRLRVSLTILRRSLHVGVILACILGPLAWWTLNGQSDAAKVYLVFLAPFGLVLALVVVLAVMPRLPARSRTVGAGATDRTFRVSWLNPRLILGCGFCLLVLAAPIALAALNGVDVTQGWHPDGIVMAILVFGALLVLAQVARQMVPAPLPSLSAGPPTVAGGGTWSVADPSQLIAVPNGPVRIHVTFVPSQDFEATGIKAAVRAVETWVATQDQRAEETGQRTNGIQTLVELPLALTGPASYRKGQPAEWDVAFDLDGQAPPTCGDIEDLGCQWALEISIDGAAGTGARFVQPILVTQPRERVNSGAMEMPEFSRYEMASGSTGPIRVDFRVSPAPLDLAAPAVADVTISNSGLPIVCKEIRLEIWAQVKVTVEPALATQQILWSDSRAASPLPSGESYLRFQIPAINRTWPDVDLPHGWMRGAMKLVVDRPSELDISVERDLCLCLDKPRRLAEPSQVATATTR
jgi:hypothetical protein